MKFYRYLLRLGSRGNLGYGLGAYSQATPAETKETLMHRACRDNNKAFVEALLATEKVQFTQDSSGKYPLDIAKNNCSGGMFGVYGFLSSGPSIAKEIIKLINDYETKPNDDLGYKM